MNLSRVNLNLLVILDVLLEERHVTHASQRLNLTQSTISAALKQLRDLFADDLLIREKNQLILTTKAQTLAPKVRSILQQLQHQVLSEVKFDPETSSRVFEVAVNEYLESTLMTEVLPELVQHAPNIKVVTRRAFAISDDLFELFPKLDLAIGLSNLVHRNIRIQQLYTEKMVCIGAGDNKLLKKPLTLEKYLNAQHLCLNQGNEYIDNYLDNALQNMGYERSVIMTVNHLSTAIYLLAGSHLIATLPFTLVDKAKKLVNIVYQPLPFDLPNIPVHQAWHAKYEHDSGHIWFRTMIQKSLNNALKWENT